MKIEKIIAIDCDGTLLNEKEVLSFKTKTVLSELAKKGFLIVIASGRPLRSLLKYYKAIGCDGPIICYNGALCFNPLDPSFPKIDLEFSKKDILSYYNKVKQMVTRFEAESSKCLYEMKRDAYLDAYFPEKGLRLIEGDLNDTLKENVYTCIFKNSHKYDSEVEKEAKKFAGIGYRHWNHSLYSELYPIGATKGNCLAHIMRIYGIEKENVYAFGDSDNDDDMLSLSGHPYAMANSKSALLKSKYPITEKGNADDGVALTLSELFLD